MEKQKSKRTLNAGQFEEAITKLSLLGGWLSDISGKEQRLDLLNFFRLYFNAEGRPTIKECLQAFILQTLRQAAQDHTCKDYISCTENDYHIQHPEDKPFPSELMELFK
jgi:hypothetical protein